MGQLAKKTKQTTGTVSRHLSTYAKGDVIRINPKGLIFAHPKIFLAKDRELANTYGMLISFARELVRSYPNKLSEETIDKLLKFCHVFIDMYEDRVGKDVADEMPGPFTYVFQDWDDHFVYGFMNKETILLLDNTLKPHPDSRYYQVLRNNPEFVAAIIASSKQAR